MTEKRFDAVEYGSVIVYRENGVNMWRNEVHVRLNELYNENEQLKEENKELKKQIEDLYENDKSLRKMMSGMSLNYQGITVHRALYSEVLKILKENGADDLCSDLEKTSIDTSINGC